MGMGTRGLLAAAILIGGAAVAGGAPPAGADYVPFTIVDPVKGPAGTVITARGDKWCATTTQEPGENIQPGVPGTVVVEFGLMQWPPNLSTETELATVLATTDATVGTDGMWSAQIAVPAGTPPGEHYGVMGHCTVEYQPEATTTTEATTSSTAVPDAVGRGATRQARATLEFDFFPAQFEVTASPGEPVTTTALTGATPANAVPGQADFTG